MMTAVDVGALPPGLGPILRREDERLLIGAGRFVDDIVVPHALHLCFVRSPHAHARLNRVVTAPALSVPGVVAAFHRRDLGQWVAPLRLAPPIDGLKPTQMPVMPVDKVRFVGDPVACVIAISPDAAADGAERVAIDYEPLAT